ncbi:MAG: dTDP-4-dehydrorhamnose 3,5-epimerase family protein [Burkholderiales bacterium]|nr:dTDP-4-dehydrorhamnose 3,5-epimerase family protein [Burkholderiales bacterium]MDE2453851.1 dTDP-4-dehydrorhamnose 3,5-epimerase family protein [Burkholderiales bacterium]
MLPGAWLVRLDRFEDARGVFVKTYARSAFESLLAARGAQGPFDMMEEFYSVSHKNVVRGMHFQVPPHDQAKIVYCVAGAVRDVLVDLRKGPGFGRHASVVLDAGDPQLLLIPKGVGHGFMSLADASVLVYKTSTEHAPSHDAGIRYDSFGFDWGGAAPILSERDRNHPRLADYVSPF